MQPKSIIFPVKCYNNINRTHIVCDVYNPENCLIARRQSYELWCSVGSAVKDAYPSILSYMKLSENYKLYPLLELQYTKCVGNDMTEFDNVSTNVKACTASIIGNNDDKRIFSVLIKKIESKYEYIVSDTDGCLLKKNNRFSNKYEYIVTNPDGCLLKKDKKWSREACVEYSLSETFKFIVSHMQKKYNNIPALVRIIDLKIKKNTSLDKTTATNKQDTFISKQNNSSYFIREISEPHNSVIFQAVNTNKRYFISKEQKLTNLINYFSNITVDVNVVYPHNCLYEVS